MSQTVRTSWNTRFYFYWFWEVSACPSNTAWAFGPRREKNSRFHFTATYEPIRPSCIKCQQLPRLQFITFHCSKEFSVHFWTELGEDRLAPPTPKLSRQDRQLRRERIPRRSDPLYDQSLESLAELSSVSTTLASSLSLPTQRKAGPNERVGPQPLLRGEPSSPAEGTGSPGNTSAPLLLAHPFSSGKSIKTIVCRLFWCTQFFIFIHNPSGRGSMAMFSNDKSVFSNRQQRSVRVIKPHLRPDPAAFSAGRVFFRWFVSTGYGFRAEPLHYCNLSNCNRNAKHSLCPENPLCGNSSKLGRVTQSRDHTKRRW